MYDHTWRVFGSGQESGDSDCSFIMPTQPTQQEDIKGGLCEKCGTWKGGSYGMSGDGVQTRHRCPTQQEDKEFEDIISGDKSYVYTDYGEEVELLFPSDVIKILKKYKSLWQKEEMENMIDKIKDYQYGFIRDDGTGEPERAPEWQVIEDLINSLK